MQPDEEHPSKESLELLVVAYSLCVAFVMGRMGRKVSSPEWRS